MRYISNKSTTPLHKEIGALQADMAGELPSVSGYPQTREERALTHAGNMYAYQRNVKKRDKGYGAVLPSLGVYHSDMNRNGK